MPKLLMSMPSPKRFLNKLALALVFLGLSTANLAASSDNDLFVTPEHRQATDLIVRLIDSHHYRKTPLNDEVSAAILERYLASLDPNRSIFLTSDVASFDVWATRLDDFLRVGYIKPGFDIFKVYRKRVQQRVATAQELLDAGFDYEIEESYAFRREEAQWPADDTQIREIWRKRVKYDFLALKLAGRDDDQARETLHKRYDGIARRATQLDSADVYQLFINAYVTGIEPHTAYFSPRTSENFKIRMSLSLEGIGAALQTENEFTVIRRLIPGGPAQKSAKLQVDDRIVGVAQGDDEPMVDVVSWRLEDVVELIRGPKDSVVHLEVLPKGAAADGPSEIVRLVRQKITLEEQAAKKSIIELDNQQGRIGVIDLPTFYLDIDARAENKPDYRSTTRDVRALIKELQTEHIDGLVIDLRGNGGGSLIEATELTGLFIETGPIVQIRNSKGAVDINDDNNPDVAYKGPLVVLVDRQSASASEIFAGAIQDYGRGLVVGEPTYGKGTVQNVVRLNRFVSPEVGALGELKVTFAQFFRINGASTQHKGVVPDIVFPTALDIETHGERALENALPWATIRAAAYEQQNWITTDVNEIRELHELRVKRDAGFSYLLAETEARLALNLIEAVSLNEAQRREEIDSREEESRRRLNQFRASRGLEPVSLDSTETVAEEDVIDILLDETAYILADVIVLSRTHKILQADFGVEKTLTAEKDR